MTITYILALVYSLQLETVAPHWVESYSSREACMKAAARANAIDAWLKTQQGRELGAEYVCLKIERDLL